MRGGAGARSGGGSVSAILLPFDSLRPLLARRLLADLLAEEAFPAGADLRCGRCGERRRVSADGCAAYLRIGWPTCCGQTMSASARRGREA